MMVSNMLEQSVVEEFCLLFFVVFRDIGTARERRFIKWCS